MKKALKSWKTTMIGVGMLLALVGHAAKDPKAITEGDLLTGAAAIGLILGKDGDQQ